MTVIAFATTKELGKVLREEQILAEAAASIGVRVAHVAWDDEAVHWQDFDLVLLRTVWNYHRSPAKFQAWMNHLQDLGIPMLNPPDLVRWNLHKGYLLELEAMGIPIVETVCVRKGECFDLSNAFQARGWSEVVIKPAISASSFQTERVPLNMKAAGQAILERMLAERDVLIQPFVPEIASDGEYSVLYFGGTYSHTVLKQAKSGDFRVQGEFGGTSKVVGLDPDIQAQTQSVLAAAPGSSLYARVDGVIRDNTFLLMELELIEPQLFLELVPGSAGLMMEKLVEFYKNGRD